MAIPEPTAERMQLEEEINILMKERIRRLNDVLQEKHLTYEQLEKQTGVAKSSIQRYLTGQTLKIPIDFFEKVARVTDTPVEYLACYDKQKTTSIGENRGDFEEYYSKLDEQGREQLKKYAEFLAGNK